MSTGRDDDDRRSETLDGDDPRSESLDTLARLDRLIGRAMTSAPPMDLGDGDIEEIDASEALPDSSDSVAQDALIFEWAALIDGADYFEILQIPRPTSIAALPNLEEVRGAFRGFALAFHPDRFADAPSHLKWAATKVFGRGSEAYRVLLDPLLSRRYLRRLEGGELRLSAHEIAQAVRGDLSDETIAGLVHSGAAIPFAQEADERLAKGDVLGALRFVDRALSFEPTNLRLDERRRELQAQAAAIDE
jgi:hypothetical protein